MKASELIEKLMPYRDKDIEVIQFGYTVEIWTKGGYNLIVELDSD